MNLMIFSQDITRCPSGIVTKAVDGGLWQPMEDMVKLKSHHPGYTEDASQRAKDGY